MTGRLAAAAYKGTVRGTWPAAVRTAAPWAVPPVGLALGVAALRGASPAGIGSLGLVDVLPLALYLALALVTAGFLAVVFFASQVRPLVLTLHLLVFTVLLHGAATLVEPLPRFIPAWLHVGFADYIARTGHTLPALDARFSWPGFFALAAMATRAAGLRDAMPLLGWTPVVLNLFLAAVVYRAARATAFSRRGAWLAAWFFIPANWVGQDYFSPQGLNFLFYGLILVTLCVWLRPSRLERARRRLRRSASSATPPGHPLRDRLLRVFGLPAAPMLHEAEPMAARGSVLAGLTAVVVLLFTASTFSHQLTPVAVLVSVAGLVVARRCSVRSLPMLLAVILLGYISYLTVAYWSGHLHDMIGSFGRVGRTVDAGVTQRVQGDRGHLIVLQVRQIFAVAVWVLGALGAWRRMRRGAGDLALLVLASAPFMLLLFQSYGGEVFLRIYTFALPFTVVLLVAAVVPAWPVRRKILAATVAVVLSAGMTGAFFLARYGNEAFEQVRPADLEAMNWLYDHAAPGVTFVALTSNVPWRSRDVEQFRYTPLGADLGPDSLPTIEDAMRANPRGAYLILTSGQYVLAESFLGKPPGWGEDIARQVAESSQFRLVYARDGAKIFVLNRAGG